jgi:hypothetical protein
MNTLKGILRAVTTAASLSLLSACTTPEPLQAVSKEDVLPRIGGNAAAIDSISPAERNHLQLIATNLIAALVQIPEMRPTTATLQISPPQTAFGNALVRALEDAGFGMQRVSADQGQRYVSYSKRLAETESGVVTDYSLAVGNIKLSREYQIRDQAIYPSSLMNITGTSYLADIELADGIFAEQGGDGNAFISGAQQTGNPDPDLKVTTVDVYSFDELPADKRTRQDRVLAEARQRYFEAGVQRAAPDLNQFAKYRRTVLIFSDNSTQMLGNVNKRAVRLLVREFSDDDVMVIKACQDADGEDQASMNRAFRVEEELAGFGVPTDSSYIAPCARTSYRHSSDNSPAPVELIHYRPKQL